MRAGASARYDDTNTNKENVMDYIKYLRKDLGSKKILLNCAGVVLARDERILLQRRADDGRWGLVGGLLELEETYAEAAIREAKEETGLDIRLDVFLGIFHNYDMVWPNGDRAHTVGAYFAASAAGGGEPRVDAESLELRFFSRADLPELYYEDHRAALRAFLDGVRNPLPNENTPAGRSVL
jgi:ADP-ribose pyrophosphatase YjhB (NUDIX family)